MPRTYTKTTAGNKTRHLLCYDSQGEFIDCALAELGQTNDSRTHAWNNEKRGETLAAYRQRHSDGGASWYGLPFRAMLDAVSAGWPEGAERILDEMRGLESIQAPVSIKRRRTRGDFGDSIDMQAVYRGAIDTAWTRCTKRSTRAPRPVTLVASMQGSGNASPAIFYARGAALLKCADLLTEAGYAVEVVADYSIEKPFERSTEDTTLTHRFPIKSAGQPLDLPRLAAAVALSGFKRHYGFLASTAAANSIDRRVLKGYGYSVDASKIDESDIIGFERATSIESAKTTAEAIIRAIEQANEQAA